jgi:recombination protein RecR
MSFSESVDQLVDCFRRLPGIGPKSAHKVVMHLLEQDRDVAERLSQSLQTALKNLSPCVRCQVICESKLCAICADSQRDHTVLCIVENQSDLQSFERVGEYFGQYYVLQGLLSPIDGIGPQELGLQHLQARISEGELSEIILALPATTEGDITSEYIHALCSQKSDVNAASNIILSRLAKGIPAGASLETMDASTLSFALNARKEEK